MTTTVECEKELTTPDLCSFANLGTQISEPPIRRFANKNPKRIELNGRWPKGAIAAALGDTKFRFAYNTPSRSHF